MKTYKVSRKDFISPRCSNACPAGVDVPRYIRAIKADRWDDAVAVLRERLPLPTVCADACFAPCEDVCACKQFGEPVAIRALKRAALDRGGDAWRKNKRRSSPTGKKVAVIGAGPAGLTAAYYLATRGHAVTMFDAWPEPGGTMRYGVPAFRLPKDRIARDVREILDLGVTFKGSTRVGRDLSFDEIRERFDAVFVACGTMANVALPLDAPEAGGVLRGWDFLKKASEGGTFDLGERVVVIGGGNVALDAARTARRLGAGQVTLVYRRTRSEMPATPEEVAEAEKEGVEILENWAPNKVLCETKVTGLGLVRCASEGDGGRECTLVEDENITFCVDADTIINAIGQKADLSFLMDSEAFASDAHLEPHLEPHLESHIEPHLEVAPDTLQTSVAGVFAGGDVVTGPDSIVGAIGQGRRAAEAIDRHLGGDGDVSERLAPAEDEVELETISLPLAPRQKMPTIEPWRRVVGFDQVETGLAKRQIETEAGRCLNCDARKFEVTLNTENCKECGYCVEVCGMDVYGPADFFNTKGYRPMERKSSDFCVGCFQCFFACPDFAINIKEAAE
ncbi:MAG: FAD-dependent oxidoreductase [Desulfobacterales bacterium]|nr:FAD-dependent oxidoreductase [Desulfobacterales bacterium]